MSAKHAAGPIHEVQNDSQGPPATDWLTIIYFSQTAHEETWKCIASQSDLDAVVCFGFWSLCSLLLQPQLLLGIYFVTTLVVS